MNKVLHTAICLMVGFSVGLSFKDNVPATETKVYDGELNSPQIEFYDKIITDANVMEIYDESQLTEEILTNRNGKIIVEKIVGKVTNDNLDGKILNCNTNNQGYISYKRVDGAKKGDKILTYCIYNPFTNVLDDVMTRLDFIIDDNSI